MPRGANLHPESLRGWETNRGGPFITSIDAEGSPDDEPGYAPHRTDGTLIINGERFEGAHVTLEKGTSSWDLQICAATPEQLTVILPGELEPDTYFLTVTNQAGDCPADLDILRGEDGATGPSGPTGPRPIIDLAGGLVGDGSSTSPLSVDFSVGIPTGTTVVSHLVDGAALEAAGFERTQTLQVGTGIWQAMRPLPHHQHCVDAVTVNDKIYVLGGQDSGGTFRKSTHEYDPTTGAWRALASMPTERYCYNAVATGGKIYVIGGVNSGGGAPETEVYDIVSDTWQSLSPPGTNNHYDAAIGVHSGKIYVIGGLDHSLGAMNPVVNVFDTQSEQWAADDDRPPDIPSNSYHSGYAQLSDGRMFVVSGYVGSTVNITRTAVFDPSTETWSEAADYPFPAHGLACTTVDDRIYCVNGYEYGVGDHNGSYMYDEANDAWVPALPASREPLRHFGLAAVGNALYQIGGYLDGGARQDNNDALVLPRLVHLYRKQ